LAPNVSEERQKGLEIRRLYLTKMGVRAEIADIIDRSRESGSATRLSRDDWSRLFPRHRPRAVNALPDG
jgi:hypothetical protein